MTKIKLHLSKDLFLLHLRDDKGDCKLGEVARVVEGECNKKRSLLIQEAKE
tara:strand:- start:230 stop:382 length:153 start_codon:yes stop_codon:yes gene_type:complete